MRRQNNIKQKAAHWQEGYFPEEQIIVTLTDEHFYRDEDLLPETACLLYCRDYHPEVLKAGRKLPDLQHQALKSAAWQFCPDERVQAFRKLGKPSQSLSPPTTAGQ